MCACLLPLHKWFLEPNNKTSPRVLKVNVAKTEQCSLPYGQSCNVCVYIIGLTYPKHEIEEHEQCFHAGHCGNSLQSFAHLCLLLMVFSEWRLPFAVWGHSYTGRSQPPACSRALARCAHAPSWTLKCKCRFYVSALHDEAFLHVTTLTSVHQVELSKRQSAVLWYIASASVDLKRKSLTGCNRCCGIPELYSSRDVRNLGKGMRVYPKIIIFFLFSFRIRNWCCLLWRNT